MTYEPMNEFFYLPHIMLILGCAAILVIGVALGLRSIVNFDGPSSKVAPIFGLVGLVGLVIAFAHTGITYSAVEQKNYTSATSNLKTKYDLKEVNWDFKDTKAKPTSTSGDDELSVEANDDRLYIFKYRVDKETGEPFLKDMPIRGGDVPEQAVTADSLLNTK